MEPLYELALFAGAGGGILGGKLLGWRTLCAVEFAEYNRASLAARQNDGCLEPFPIWDDVRTFTKRNGAVRRVIRRLRRLRRRLVITGGFPCQDISSAGKGAGIDGERSGLWSEFARIIREIRPGRVLVENSAMLTSRGLGRVLGDLAAMGYDASWGVLGAEDAIWYFGDPCLDHERKRIWIVATLADGKGQRRGEAWGVRHDESAERIAGSGKAVADSLCFGRDEGRSEFCAVRRVTELAVGNQSGAVRPAAAAMHADGQRLEEFSVGDGPDLSRQSDGRFSADGRESWWANEPAVGRVAHGVAHRVDRLYGIGNGQVPAVVALAWHILSGGVTEL